jgi:hypothetical protein
MEDEFASRGKRLNESTIEEMEAAWQSLKNKPL